MFGNTAELVDLAKGFEPIFGRFGMPAPLDNKGLAISPPIGSLFPEIFGRF